MERLKNMKETLLSAAQSQMGNLAATDTKELGQVIDMIKDLEEAIYYCSITEAIKENKEKEKYSQMYYQERYLPIPMMNEMYQRDMDRNSYGRMYYPDRIMNNRDESTNRGGSRYYTERDWDTYPINTRDSREGRSPLSRKNYMEAKELHQGKEIQMKELDKYIQELGHDITEMIQDASPEEKQMLQQKISALATKIK